MVSGKANSRIDASGPLPQVIQIQTTTYCNRSCTWCPNSLLGPRRHFMEETLYESILTKCALAGYKGIIRPYLMAEPLTDDRLDRFISLSKKILPENPVSIITNGDFLTRERMDQLLAAGLDYGAVSHYDRKNQPLFELRHDYPQFKHVDLALNLFHFYNRGGNIEFPPPIEAGKRTACEWLWTKLYINYQGQAVLCCSDYKFEVIMGDFRSQDLTEIWYGDRYLDYRNAHRTGKGKTMPLCRECNRIADKTC